MPTLVVIDDDPMVLRLFRRLLGDDGFQVVTAETGEQGIAAVREARPDVLVIDVGLPDESGLATFERARQFDAHLPILVISASENSDTAIEAMKLGAYEFLVKPLDFPRFRETAQKALAIRRLMNVPVRLSAPLDTDPALGGDLLVGRCPEMQEVYKSIGRVAPQSATVLIRGESGTGKELVARAIYQHSHRKAGKFLAVNCAAIPEALLESELFGHERGAFTGAETRKIGKFEQCSGGTVFLDEIGDMTPLSQSKVLRVLQDQRFERVGGHETIRTDVRIIAATNRDLEQMTSDGRFRTDLYYRLQGFSISLPPLRVRGDDIPLLVRHYLHRFRTELNKNVTEIEPEALQRLCDYAWPGNVRQLQAVLRQAMLQATGPVLSVEFLPAEIEAEPVNDVSSTSGRGASGHDSVERFIELQLPLETGNLYADCTEQLERMLLTRVLRHTGGNQSQAARILGITRSFLRKKVLQLHISIVPVVGIEEPDAEENVSLEVEK
jgi:DNA-binding NtrC family response regulator